jgi:hypothetical protein
VTGTATWNWVVNHHQHSPRLARLCNCVSRIETWRWHDYFSAALISVILISNNKVFPASG